MIKALLNELYGLSADCVEKSSVGAGSDTYFVTCGDAKYVIKYPCESGVNHLDMEPRLCAFLSSKELGVSKFVQNSAGKFISVDSEKRKFHVQHFVAGKTFT